MSRNFKSPPLARGRVDKPESQTGVVREGNSVLGNFALTCHSVEPSCISIWSN